MSSSVKAGIGIGVGVGGAAIIAAIAILVLYRHKKRKGVVAKEGVSELDGKTVQALVPTAMNINEART